jgi:hypothetical protein
MLIVDGALDTYPAPRDGAVPHSWMRDLESLDETNLRFLRLQSG